MSEIQIKLDEVHPIELLGSNDHKLKIIQDSFPNLKIIARGNVITLKGAEEDMLRVHDKITLMIKHILKYTTMSENKLKEILTSENASLLLDEQTDKSIIVRGNSGLIIRAKTPNQQKLVDAVNDNNIIFATGPAGTGKTYTSVALAVRALKNKEVRRIILTRPAVEAGENLGFLPGDLKEKIDPYLRPLYDALDDMIPPEKLRNFMEYRVIEVAPLAFMRGRTLNNAFVILDEAQNATAMQLKMFLTRLGPNAIFIVNGDLTQIDLPKRQNSGLISTINLLKEIKGISLIEFDKRDVSRHKLVSDIISAYESLQEED